MKKETTWPNIVFFDGVCVLCNASVDFLIRKDKKGILKYASLQSDLARKALSEDIFLKAGLDTVIFLSDGKITDQSTAILKILGHLPFPWSLAVIFLPVPKFIRNFVYRIIARNRYKWFGKRETCRMPDETTKDRILN